MPNGVSVPSDFPQVVITAVLKLAVESGGAGLLNARLIREAKRKVLGEQTANRHGTSGGSAQAIVRGNDELPRMDQGFERAGWGESSRRPTPRSHSSGERKEHHRELKLHRPTEI
jgi:hypothetical protein